MRPFETGRAGDTLESCNEPACAAAQKLFLVCFFNAHLRGLFEAGDVRLLRDGGCFI